MSRLAVALTAFIAAGVLWLESRHHITIDAPASPVDSVAPAAPPARTAPAVAVVATVTAACPDNDNVPYSAGCLAFLKGATETGMRWRIKAEERAAVVRPDPPDVAELAAPTAASVCPANDTMPYSASCLAFLTGPGQGSRPH